MSPKLVKLEDVTIERMLAARAVRASDGYLSRLLWENPASPPTADLLIDVAEVSEEFVAPLRQRVSQLLIASQQTHDAAAAATPARGFRAGAFRR